MLFCAEGRPRRAGRSAARRRATRGPDGARRGLGAGNLRLPRPREPVTCHTGDPRPLDLVATGKTTTRRIDRTARHAAGGLRAIALRTPNPSRASPHAYHINITVSLRLLLVRARRQPRQRASAAASASASGAPSAPSFKRLHMRLRFFKGRLVLLGPIRIAEADREDRVLELAADEVPRGPDPRPVAADVRLELDARDRRRGCR